MKNLIVKSLIIELWLFYTFNSYSQTISGVINTYYSVTAISNGCGTCTSICSPSFTLASTSGLNVGDKVLVIQMQVGSGAAIDHGTTYRFSSLYGTVTNTSGAGNYEFATIGAISGNIVQFTLPLVNSYDVAGKVQLVKIPVYSSVSTSGDVTGQSWNGTTGGVLALEVTGTLTIAHNFDMRYTGFRGAAYVNVKKACCNGAGDLGALTGSYYFNGATIYSPTNSCADEGNLGAFKGEGIYPLISGEELGRGAFANAGGGGSGHNGGGGGGGNVTSGGNGGWEFQPCTNYAASDMGGRGGYSVDICNSSQVIMGGGGGAGHSEDNKTPQGRGGNGGGIIIIKASTVNVTGTGLLITADGENGGDSYSDGAGGAGGGGSILLNVSTFTGNSLSISANGGIGGYHARGNCCITCHGPGGGGGGGKIYSSVSLTGNTVSALAGSNGISGGLISSGVPCLNFGATSGTTSTDGTGCTGLTIIENSCSLPVVITSFNINKIDNNTVSVDWTVTQEKDIDHYEVLRSSDAITWTSLGQEKEGYFNYNLEDPNPRPGINYYRLKIVGSDNNYNYGEVKSVFIGSKFQIGRIALINDSKTEYSIVLENFSPYKEKIDLILFNINGQELERFNWSVAQGVSSHNILLEKYSSGIYYLKIINSNNVEINQVLTIK